MTFLPKNVNVRIFLVLFIEENWKKKSVAVLGCLFSSLPSVFMLFLF